VQSNRKGKNLDDQIGIFSLKDDMKYDECG
jgi:hypothetical protein